MAACESESEPTATPIPPTEIPATATPSPIPPTPTDVPTAREGVVVIPPGDTVKIGVATDLSNILPAPGLDIAQGAELAVIDYTEERGGLFDFEIELVVQDDLCVEDGAIAVAQEFAARGDILAVVGHVCSGASIPASVIYQEARIPMVSPSSTAGVFTARGLDVVNRTAFNDNIQGVVAARYIYQELGAREIVVLHNQTSYGEGLATTVAETFEELGGAVLMFQAIDIDEEDYRMILRAAATLDTELIYLGGYDDEASRLVTQMNELGLDDTLFFSDDGAYTSDFLELAEENAEGIYVTFGTQSAGEDVQTTFAEHYEMTFGVDPQELGPFHGQSYDAANIILQALEEVAKFDDDGNLLIDRELLIDAIRATKGYQGQSGTVSCDDNGDCGSAEISVFRVVDGGWERQDVPQELQVLQQ
jgi:branched-chain amino acid transport system substrate-binding protein